MIEIRFEPKYLQDGVQCSHPGCINHVSHPCEGCGRIQSSYYLTVKYYIKLLKESEVYIKKLEMAITELISKY